MNTLCPACKKEIDEDENFCPNCGQSLVESDSEKKPLKKGRIFLASFFLSPLGLIWFFKYFRDEDMKKRKLAYISLVLTLLPLMTTFLIGDKYISVLTDSLDLYKANMDVYSQLGI